MGGPAAPGPPHQLCRLPAYPSEALLLDLSFEARGGGVEPRPQSGRVMPGLQLWLVGFHKWSCLSGVTGWWPAQALGFLALSPSSWRAPRVAGRAALFPRRGMACGTGSRVPGQDLVATGPACLLHSTLLAHFSQRGLQGAALANRTPVSYPSVPPPVFSTRPFHYKDPGPAWADTGSWSPADQTRRKGEPGSASWPTPWLGV